VNAKLLDTDMLSEVLKRRNPQVLSHARGYLASHGRFAFSDMTIYEIARGLKTTGATQQLAHFYRVASTSDVIPIDLPILKRAADLIIAATACETGRVLVTGNTSHFAWISELTLEDWRKPWCSWVKANE
jgi:predicted nucleic acid-binding protein